MGRIIDLQAISYGNMLGPSSSIDNQMMRFYGTSGHLVQTAPGIIVYDNGSIKYQNVTDSTTAYQWLDADGGVPVMNIDTTNERVGIGTAVPTAKLHVVGNIKMVDGNQSNGYILTCDAAGVGSWQEAAEGGWDGQSDLAIANGVKLTGGYLRIGDGGTPTYTDGDGDLYIEDDLEVDGNCYVQKRMGIGIGIATNAISNVKGEFNTSGKQYSLFFAASNAYTSDRCFCVGVGGSAANAATSGNYDKFSYGVQANASTQPLSEGTAKCFGVHGFANSGNSHYNYGIYGSASNGITENWAGFFYGNLAVVNGFVNITYTAPYMTYHNSTEQNITGGRKSLTIHKGEKANGFEHVLGIQEFSHDLDQDDQKGRYILSLNAGADDDTPTEVHRVDSTGLMTVKNVIQGATSLWWRIQRIDLSAIPATGAVGAIYTTQSANNLNGYQLDNNPSEEYLYFNAHAGADWDGASDLEVHIQFETNVDNSGGGGSGTDTVDFDLVMYYKGNTETVQKTQVLAASVVVGEAAQYYHSSAVFTIDYDKVDHVLNVGDCISFRLHLNTDDSEVDDVIVHHAMFRYKTNKVREEV